MKSVVVLVSCDNILRLYSPIYYLRVLRSTRTFLLLSDASSTGSGSKQLNENDPLSQIDPLWPIKRFS